MERLWSQIFRDIKQYNQIKKRLRKLITDSNEKKAKC